MSKRNSKKTIHVGTITRADILRGPKGHQVKIGGCGPHDNRSKRLRTRKARSDRAIREQF